jgi:hypothetical protein
MAEDEEYKAFQLRLPVPLYIEMQKRIKESRRSLNAEIIVCLEEYLKGQRYFKATGFSDKISSLSTVEDGNERYALAKEVLKKYLDEYIDGLADTLGSGLSPKSAKSEE